MMMKKLLAALCLATGIICTMQAAPGYEIKIHVKGLKNTQITLAHYFAKENLTFIKDDSVQLNRNGEAVLSKSTPLTGGMYIIILPGQKFFDLLISDSQHFSVETDTTNLTKNITFRGSRENELFYGYRNLITSKSAQMKTLSEEFVRASQARRDSINKIRAEVNTEVKTYIRQAIDNNKGTFFSKWLTALQEIEVPPLPRDNKGNVTDSTFQYKYWHKHYFDNFDLADARLLHTPFYERKVIDYLDKAAIQIPDSIAKETDLLIAKAGDNEEIRRYMLGTIYNHLADKANKIVGMDGAFVYFAEKYYLPLATWTDAKFRADLQKDIARIKPNLIGKEAPALPLAEVPTEHFTTAKNDMETKKSMQVGRLMKLQDIKAKFTVLAFWEEDCGHCKKEIPLLYDSIYPILKDKGVKIVAIHMLTGQEAKVKWVDFVNDHKLYDWINALPLDYAYKESYNIVSTPTLYVLDENKRILYKRIGIKQLPQVIDMELKRPRP